MLFWKILFLRILKYIHRIKINHVKISNIPYNNSNGFFYEQEYNYIIMIQGEYLTTRFRFC